jgi:hypothetical protein
MRSYNGFSPAQRLRALAWLKGEYAAGRRRPPTACDACGQTEGIIEAHSEDYSEPFGDHIGAYGLCYRCHMAVHTRFGAWEAWHTYRRLVAAGARFQPFPRRDWERFKAEHLGERLAAPVAVYGGPPQRRVLDEIDRAWRARRARQLTEGVAGQGAWGAGAEAGSA